MVDTAAVKHLIKTDESADFLAHPCSGAARIMTGAAQVQAHAIYYT